MRGIRTGPVALGGSCEGGKVSIRWEAPSLVGSERGLWKRGELEEEHRNRRQRGERLTRRPCACDACPEGWWGLAARLGFGGQTQGEDWGWLREDSPRVLGVVYCK